MRMERFQRVSRESINDWANEDLNKKATRHIREYGDVKGQPNLTVGMFCQWVNDHLLPNEMLDLFLILCFLFYCYFKCYSKKSPLEILLSVSINLSVILEYITILLKKYIPFKMTT